MKTLLTIILLVILFSCKKETTTTTTSDITATLGNCKTQSCENKNYEICFDSLLEDSRCPINANCIWQGVARAKFRFKTGSQEHIIRLSTLTMAPHYAMDTTVAGFHLKLVNILPYPVHPNTQQAPITATVEITH